MNHGHGIRGAIDYFPCRYGNSKLQFRGPKKFLGGKYSVALGGTETFGKFMDAPYPDLLEGLTGLTVVNLGCMFSGVDAMLNDPVILEVSQKAELVVLQLPSVSNMSNRFYSVHPRRNDRFVGATAVLYSIFPDLDFADVHYTGHLMATLRATSTSRHALILQDLRREWVVKMKELLGCLGERVVLLFISDRSADWPDTYPLGHASLPQPNREMIELISENCLGLVEVLATAEEISAGHNRMTFSQFEEPAALQMLGPIAHQEAARGLAPFFELAK